MKQLLKLFLFMALLCLTGCSSDEPQSVAFLTHEAAITAGGESISVSIEANCPWTITEQSDIVSVQPTSGDGSSTVKIMIGTNASYEDLTHTLTLCSGDGSSKDSFIVKQEKDYAVQATPTDMISCEGGSFSVPVNTNDNISKVETPEWITFTESRSLTNYTYHFTAAPNKTGAVRQATVSLVGTKTNGDFQMKQDSYSPTSVEAYIPDIVELAQMPIVCPIGLIPDYADWEKLSVNANDCTTGIAEKNLTINTSETGLFTLRFLSNSNEIFNKELMVVSSFDADSVAIDIPDTLALSENPYEFPIELFPNYAKPDLISIGSHDLESSFDGKSVFISVDKEGTFSVKIYSSENEIYSKEIVVYDYTYPTSVEIDAPDVLCKGRHAFKIKVLPENADMSKLSFLTSHDTSASIEGDSLIMNVHRDIFDPYVYFYSRRSRIGGKDFDIISDEATFNIHNGDIFVVGEVIDIEPVIPLEYSDIYFSDKTVLQETGLGKYKVIGEGTSSIIVTNKISKKEVPVWVDCRNCYMEVTYASASRILIDWALNFKVAFKCYGVGPGTLYLEHDVFGGRKVVVKEFKQELNVKEITDFNVSDYIIISGMYPGDYDTRPKRYRLVYEGILHGENTVIETEWGTIK